VNKTELSLVIGVNVSTFISTNVNISLCVCVCEERTDLKTLSSTYVNH